MSLTLDEGAILRAINDNFMNQVQVILTLYAKYNPHMLGLLEDASYEQRVKRLRAVVTVYSRTFREFSSTQRAILKRRKKIEALKIYKMEPIPVDLQEEDGPKKRKVFAGWRNEQKAEIEQGLLAGDIEYYEMILNQHAQSEGHFAIFRPIALVEAFQEYKKKISNVVGVGEEQMKDVKRQLAKKRKAKDGGESTSRMDQIKARLGAGGKDDASKIKKDGKKSFGGSMTDIDIQIAKDAGVRAEDIMEEKK